MFENVIVWKANCENRVHLTSAQTAGMPSQS